MDDQFLLNRAAVHLANLRTLCEELEQIIGETNDRAKLVPCVNDLRYLERKLEGVVRVAALAAGLVAVN
jgi:hypothetical protein